MSDELSTRVAWLYYMENLTQAAIGERLSLTRAHVNRILANARESGLVRISVNSNFADCAALEQRVKEECGLADAVVIPTPDDPDLLAGLLGMAAGEYLSRFLEDRPIKVLGVGWGATIRETIRHVRVGRYPELWITSMMGGLPQGLELNTFEIAGELAKRLQARCSYLAAPIYASSARSRDTILDQEVFQPLLARLAKVELAVLSLGDLSTRSLLVRHGLPSDVTVDELRAKGAVGDVLGQFLDQQGRPIAHAINRRAIALPLADLARIHTVMLVAGGANKTGIIGAALNGGFANVLVTDDKTLARALALVKRKS